MLRMLNTEDAERIHEASLRVVCELGMALEDEGLREFLRVSGVSVDEGRGRVRFPRELVEHALATAPRQISLWSHHGDELPLRKREPHVGTYDNAVSVLDFGASCGRPSTRHDLARFVRLGDALPEVHIVKPACRALDVPEPTQALHSAAATVANSAKHTEAAPHCLQEAQLWSDLVAIADLGLNPHPGPTLSFVVSSTSPLRLDGDTAQVLRHGAERGIPLILTPCPMAGATSPYTIAGTLVQSNAENLWMLTLAQMINEGTPVILGGAAGPVDMRSGRLSYGCPERHLMLGGNIELASFYGLPHSSPAGTVDAGLPDVQCGAAKMLTWIMRLLNGICLGIAIGSVLTGSTVSLEQMVIDVDLLRSAQRALRGFRVNQETMAVEAITRVDAGGEFLLDEHTLRWVRSDEYYLSPLANRRGVEGMSMLERAHQQVEALLAAHTPSVSPVVIAEIEAYVGERENPSS